MHDVIEEAPLFVQVHGEVGSLLVQGALPVREAATDAFPLHKADQGNPLAVRLKQILPEAIHLVAAVLFLQIGEQFTVRGDKFGTGNHKYYLQC